MHLLLESTEVDNKLLEDLYAAVDHEVVGGLRFLERTPHDPHKLASKVKEFACLLVNI
jgi:hypothetical protein